MDNKISFIKKPFKRISIFLGKRTAVQKISFAVIAIVIIAGIIALLSVPAMVTVIHVPINDETVFTRIVARINQKGIKTSVSADGLIRAADEDTARRIRAILIQEDILPAEFERWSIYDKSIFERGEYSQKNFTQMLTNLIKAIDDVDDAEVIIFWSQKELFIADQNPISATVIIVPKPESDITENRKKIEGIQKILKFFIEGLEDENIAITDKAGIVLNDFDVEFYIEPSDDVISKEVVSIEKVK